MDNFLIKLNVFIQSFLYRFREAVFVTKNQYKLKLLHCYIANNDQIVAMMQVAIKRVKVKFSLRYLACNPKILQHIHPVEVCKISFIANIGNDIGYNQLPEYIKTSCASLSIIKQSPTLKISSQSFSNNGNETIFEIADINSNYQKTLTAIELAQSHSLLYSLGSLEAARVGISASNDFLKTVLVDSSKRENYPSQGSPNFHYYHILCICYITLILTGISIVRRMFPFYVPFTDIVIPFGGGIIFFPITFCIQDITTEVYGFSAARQMIVLSIFSILFYVFYSQIVIHLPTDTSAIYQDNPAFATVFNTQPRQVIALLVSLFIGSIINDFFLSKSKVIVAGQYLWARILGSTMLGEAVLQIVGGVIGFSDKLDFKTQLLPNMILAYGYKLLWCGATIPLIYMISRFLKKKEGVDVFDYNINYNPFQFTFASKKN
ncbi:MAG: queuosine precursor transporter [Legionella sp.]|nr:queuosine precursor transporter [Legionella sp.]